MMKLRSGEVVIYAAVVCFHHRNCNRETTLAKLNFASSPPALFKHFLSTFFFLSVCKQTRQRASTFCVGARQRILCTRLIVDTQALLEIFSVFPKASPPRALIYDLSIKEINHVCARVFITQTMEAQKKVIETKGKSDSAKSERKT
jgi:hypothetical protein